VVAGKISLLRRQLIGFLAAAQASAKADILRQDNETFMREAVAWDGSRDLLGFGAALALVIAALSLYLAVKGKH